MGIAGSTPIRSTSAGITSAGITRMVEETPAAISPSAVRLAATIPPDTGPAPATKCWKLKKGMMTAASSSTATRIPDSATMTDRHCRSSVGRGMSDPMWKRMGATRIV